ncbi:hypothetical protein SELMODRAFT_420938 [Selaginella moellendorffii]|uniref:SAM domain-containing protein n=1 Tax=Selaginella moellendorffii TaxID=88036 RepID=D8SDL7_SELML|nr:hypothetical protein SELMODRAFT_420938 [Selaginella moellendorffii]
MDWKSWLTPCSMEKHAILFHENELNGEHIPDFNHDLLKSIGVKNASDRISILKHRDSQIGKASNEKVSKIVGDAQSDIISRLKQSGGISEEMLLGWVKEKWPKCQRNVLVKQGDEHRTESGKMLLENAKDMLWALLFGDAESSVNLDRDQRELLSLTVPQKKAYAFNFFQAVTEVGVSGTWRDPDNVSNDIGAHNILLQIEFGDTSSELVGDGIMVCIHLINLLQVNEQVLYARMSNVEQSTLLTSLHFQK